MPFVRRGPVHHKLHSLATGNGALCCAHTPSESPAGDKGKKLITRQHKYRARYKTWSHEHAPHSENATKLPFEDNVTR